MWILFYFLYKKELQADIIDVDLPKFATFCVKTVTNITLGMWKIKECSWQ